MEREEIEACRNRGGGFEVAPNVCISCEQFRHCFPEEYTKHKMKEGSITYYEGFLPKVKKDENNTTIQRSTRIHG